jgi:drug/metabolite transporter (DMT)-like permease
MTDTGWLWVIFTLIAAAGQTARNAMQRELTATLGTVGATHVRFLFGFPFALVSLAGVLAVTGVSVPHTPAVFWPWVLAGSIGQILATALMLAAMGERSFVIVTALIKTEAVQVAVFGLVFLGDRLSIGMSAAILISTAGVIIMSFKGGSPSAVGFRPVAVGIISGAMFAIAAIGYRGAILSLEHPNFVVAATFTLAVGLVIQAALLSAYLVWREPSTFGAIIGSWRRSLFAGFMGALASNFWFLAFAIATAASVRTLALVEVLFAQAISYFVFKQPTTRRESFGIVLVVIGVVLLIWAH